MKGHIMTKSQDDNAAEGTLRDTFLPNCDLQAYVLPNGETPVVHVQGTDAAAAVKPTGLCAPSPFSGS
jgi:hypothetical protein